MFLANAKQESPGYNIGRQNGTTDGDAEGDAEDDVQLLRMRTKNYEIVIFPDRKFLCCVIQDITKGLQGQNNSGGR